MISMLMVAASLFSMLCTACDDDDDIPLSPKETFKGKVTTTAFGVTLDPTDWEIRTDNIKANSLSLVFGEFTVVVPMPGGNTVSRTIKRCMIENVSYEYKDGASILAPGEYETTDGVFETIKYEILSGTITSKGMKLTMKVQPEGMPIPMVLDFTTFKE